MQASLSLALSLCLGCAATVPWGGSLDRLPDLHARALVAGAGAFATATQAGAERIADLAARALQDPAGAMDPTATVSEEEVQAWQDLLEVATPGVALPVVTAQVQPGWLLASPDPRIAAALRTHAPR